MVGLTGRTHRGVARHEELVHGFGLDQPEVTETDVGWAVRIERQLTCAAAVAWDLWFGKDRDTGEQRNAPAVGEPLTPYMAPDMVIGTMTEVDLHQVFAFDVAPTGGPGEHLRLEFADGTGRGVKVALTVTGSDPAVCVAVSVCCCQCVLRCRCVTCGCRGSAARCVRSRCRSASCSSGRRSWCGWRGRRSRRGSGWRTCLTLSACSG